MKLPSALLNDTGLEVAEKIDDPDGQAKSEVFANKKLETEVNWTPILEETKGLDFDKLLKIYLLKQPSQKVIDKVKSDTTLGQKEMILKIVSLPEYSLA
jgi:hypothetical protein